MIDTIQEIAEELIEHVEMSQEDWQLRKKILKDIIENDYYDYCGCNDRVCGKAMYE